MNTTVFVTIDHVTCCNCGIVFGIETSHNQRLKREGGTFHCPNGHGQHYAETACTRAEKAAARAQELLAQERESVRHQRERAEACERKLSATRGYVTRIKNRLSAGVCPCCNRTFQNLARHMKGQHPEYAAKEQP